MSDCPGVGPAYVHLAAGVTCADVAADWNAARLTLLGAGLTDATLGTWSLVYVVGTAFPAGDGLDASGQTAPANKTIRIAAGARCSLVHEAFHAYEWDVDHVSNPGHVGWDARGWKADVAAVCNAPPYAPAVTP
ncbi:MAG TPA: hypothetical protein VMH40_16625 [Myxococcaceae bacterium]|nr:hypothetical protein [Myxococcaceae bacterium]